MNHLTPSKFDSAHCKPGQSKAISYSIHLRQTTYGKTLNSSFPILQGGYQQAGIPLLDCRERYYEMKAVLW